MTIALPESSRNTLKLVCYAGFLILAATAFAAEPAKFFPLYTAEGVIEQTSRSRDNLKPRTNAVGFRISVGTNGLWQITTRRYIARYDMTTTNHLSFNGTDIFSVLYSDKRLDGKMKPVSNLPAENNGHPGEVSHGPVPVDYTADIGLLWLAFCAGEYATQQPGIEIPNVLGIVPRREPTAWCTDFHFKLLTGSPNPLVESAEFILNTNKVFADLAHYPELDEPDTDAQAKRAEQTLALLKEIKQDQALRSAYSLSKSERFNQVQVPIEFFATCYGDPLSPTGVPMVLTARVTNVIKGEIGELLPPVVGKINAQDKRFRRKAGILSRKEIWYKLDQNGWVVSTDEAQSKARASAFALATRPSIVWQHHRQALLVVICGVLGVLALCVVTIKHSKSKAANAVNH